MAGVLFIAVLILVPVTVRGMASLNEKLSHHTPSKHLHQN